MAYGSDPSNSPSDAAGQPNGTGAAASSIRQSTWPYQRRAGMATQPQILLRPPDVDLGDVDPLIAAIKSLQGTMTEVLRATRLISAPWLVFPPDAESVHKASGIPMPAVDGLYHVIVSVTVPPGRNGVINEIANVIVGGGFADFSGLFQWQIQRNPSVGIVPAERNYELITASLGLVDAPTTIAPIRVFENDVLVLVGQNLGLPTGGPELGGLFGGWWYPKTWDDQFEKQDHEISW